MPLDLSLKQGLYQVCSDLTDQQISISKDAIETAKEAANEETKSSVGDKFETGRAMAQREEEKASLQLLEAVRLKQVLDQVPSDRSCEKVELGAMVITSNGRFFISIPLGKIDFQGEPWFLISPASPIGRQLIGKKKGDKLMFNNRDYDILDVL